MNVFTKVLYLYFRIESLFEAVVTWYHVTVIKRLLFYLNKKQFIGRYNTII